MHQGQCPICFAVLEVRQVAPCFMCGGLPASGPHWERANYGNRDQIQGEAAKAPVVPGRVMLLVTELGELRKATSCRWPFLHTPESRPPKSSIDDETVSIIRCCKLASAMNRWVFPNAIICGRRDGTILNGTSRCMRSVASIGLSPGSCCAWREFRRLWLGCGRREAAPGCKAENRLPSSSMRKSSDYRGSGQPIMTSSASPSPLLDATDRGYNREIDPGNNDKGERPMEQREPKLLGRGNRGTCWDWVACRGRGHSSLWFARTSL